MTVRVTVYTDVVQPRNTHTHAHTGTHSVTHTAVCVLPLADEDVVEPLKVTEVENQSESQPSGSAPAPVCCGVNELQQLVQEQQEMRSWLAETVKLLMQIVREDKEESSVQAEILKLLRAMRETQDTQLTHVGNMARQHNLLVENHQALLFQVSRIGSILQEHCKLSQ